MQERRYLRKQESLECKEGLMAVLYGRNKRPTVAVGGCAVL